MVESASQLPVEVQIENQKILKCQMEIQKLLQIAEYECETMENLKDVIQLARKELGVLRSMVTHFLQLAEEWKYELNFDSCIKPVYVQHSKLLQSLQAALQKACVAGEDRIAKVLRVSLISSESDIGGDKTRQRKLDKSQMASKAGDITRNLISIARTMDAQVKQSEESNSLLKDSSEVIKLTHDEYKGLTGIISLSRKLINKYNRRELTDTLLIFFGLIFFFATVVYIISKRL